MAMASDYQANHRELWELWCFLGIPGINFDEKGVPLFQKPPNVPIKKRLILHCRVRLLQVGSRTFAIQAREAKVAGSTSNIPYTNGKKTRPAKILYKCNAVLKCIEYWY